LFLNVNFLPKIWVIVFDATFNNISAISRWSVLLVKETGQLFQVTIKFDEMMMIMKGKSNIEGQQFYEYQHH
jgi:hypothetical protein